jgi:nitrite reductase/ring-hydroxylating ferredoxin subunit
MLNKAEAISNACASCMASHRDSEETVAIGRRQFISASVLAAAAAALAACSASGSSDFTGPSSVGGLTLKLSDYATLASVGGVALVSASGSPIAVVRTGASTFIALSRVCPHQGSTVNLVANGFLCPNHGASFTLDGTWTGGQRTSNMRSYTTTYDSAAGTITIA